MYITPASSIGRAYDWVCGACDYAWPRDHDVCGYCLRDRKDASNRSLVRESYMEHRKRRPSPWKRDLREQFLEMLELSPMSFGKQLEQRKFDDILNEPFLQTSRFRVPLTRKGTALHAAVNKDRPDIALELIARCPAMIFIPDHEGLMPHECIPSHESQRPMWNGCARLFCIPPHPKMPKCISPTHPKMPKMPQPDGAEQQKEREEHGRRRRWDVSCFNARWRPVVLRIDRVWFNRVAATLLLLGGRTPESPFHRLPKELLDHVLHYISPNMQTPIYTYEGPLSARFKSCYSQAPVETPCANTASNGQNTSAQAKTGVQKTCAETPGRSEVKIEAHDVGNSEKPAESVGLPPRAKKKKRALELVPCDHAGCGEMVPFDEYESHALKHAVEEAKRAPASADDDMLTFNRWRQAGGADLKDYLDLPEAPGGIELAANDSGGGFDPIGEELKSAMAARSKSIYENIKKSNQRRAKKKQSTSWGESLFGGPVDHHDEKSSGDVDGLFSFNTNATMQAEQRSKTNEGRSYVQPSAVAIDRYFRPQPVAQQPPAEPQNASDKSNDKSDELGGEWPASVDLDLSRSSTAARETSTAAVASGEAALELDLFATRRSTVSSKSETATINSADGATCDVNVSDEKDQSPVGQEVQTDEKHRSQTTQEAHAHQPLRSKPKDNPKDNPTQWDYIPCDFGSCRELVPVPEYESHLLAHELALAGDRFDFTTPSPAANQRRSTAPTQHTETTPASQAGQAGQAGQTGRVFESKLQSVPSIFESKLQSVPSASGSGDPMTVEAVCSSPSEPSATSAASTTGSRSRRKRRSANRRVSGDLCRAPEGYDHLRQNVTATAVEAHPCSGSAEMLQATEDTKPVSIPWKCDYCEQLVDLSQTNKIRHWKQCPSVARPK